MKHLILWLASLLLVSTACSNKKESTHPQIFTLAVLEDPVGFDPRKVHDLISATFLNMIYEGLVARDEQGKIHPAVAECIQVSPDNKTYTFFLRPSLWADGSPLTAYDFEKTWKSHLDPHFPAPNAHQFFAIKNAHLAKQGSVSPEEIGIKAISPNQLIVELEAPVPYFLELVASYFYLPTHPAILALSESESITPALLIGNGPFKMTSWQRRRELVFEKNLLYWNEAEIKLEGISAMVLDENTSLQMFLAGQLDWIGSPLSLLPQDSFPLLKQKNVFQSSPVAGIQWLYCNVNHPVLNNRWLRQALSQAIDRENLVNHVLEGGQLPAYTVIPRSFDMLVSNEIAQRSEISKAKESLYKALEEMNLTLDQLPPLVLSYNSNERSKKIVQVLQEQWVKNLGIKVQLINSELKVLLDKTINKDYQLALLSWYADIRDPINFLDLFTNAESKRNRTGWESSTYQQLLEAADHEPDPKKRRKLLSEADGLLAFELPVIPLFTPANNFAKSPRINGVSVSDLGYLDFKKAYIKQNLD